MESWFSPPRIWKRALVFEAVDSEVWSGWSSVSWASSTGCSLVSVEVDARSAWVVVVVGTGWGGVGPCCMVCGHNIMRMQCRRASERMTGL